MKEDGIVTVDELMKEDNFKKVEITPDSTDLMSDFSDK